MSDWFAPLKAWIGRSEERRDVAAPAPVAALAATLDHESPPWRDGEVPPLGHWLYFLPLYRQSEVGADGHAKRGGFLPPVPLPRRMWAGGRLSWHEPLRLGADVRRRSTVADISHETGRSGELCFVKVVHEVFGDAGLAVREEHDIVYRGPAPQAGAEVPAKPAEPLPEAAWTRTITPDPVLLFRFSALTFNGHRIHYDRDYCRDVEGYPGLVFHGPLTAMLLVDLFLRHHPAAPLSTLSFRAQRPLFDTRPFAIRGRPRPGGATLWALTPDGLPAMTAEIATGEPRAGHRLCGHAAPPARPV